jgi:hypothetical protein
VFQGHVVVLATEATFYSRPLTEDLEWQRTEAKTGNDLLALTLGSPDVAVEESGTIVERVRGGPEHRSCVCGPECDYGDDCRCDETGNCECDNGTCGHDCHCGRVGAAAGAPAAERVALDFDDATPFCDRQ